MTQTQALDFLDSRISIGWKLGLESIRNMLAELGDPQRQTRFVHIAGTNGKGSVAAMLAAIFRAAGYKTGLYTSPHLVDMRERIQLAGEKIPPQDFSRLLEKMQPVILKFNATYFETLTALAFCHFAEQKTDIVILEVGLGGRLDATNVVDSELTIITSISFDHTEYLGTTLAQIAGEKAGIIKNNRPVLVGQLPPEAEQVIAEKAAENRAAFYKAADLCRTSVLREEIGRTIFSISGAKNYNGQFELAMTGALQVSNARIALAACELLSHSKWKLPAENVATGLARVSWPGRFQRVRENPEVIFDVAHNEASIEQLVVLLRRFYADKKIYVVIGLLKDKAIESIAQKIASVAYAVQPVAPEASRALPAEQLFAVFLAKNVTLFSPSTVSGGMKRVYSMLDNNSVMCVAGSHYVVGEAMAATNSLTK